MKSTNSAHQVLTALYLLTAKEQVWHFCDATCWDAYGLLTQAPQSQWRAMQVGSENGIHHGLMFRLRLPRSSAMDGSRYFCTTLLKAGKQRLSHSLRA